MAKNRGGRPVATNPRNIQVGVRLTEQEADQLMRLAGEGTLAQAIRHCITGYISMMRQGRQLPDTERAKIARERRKAKRADIPETAELEQLFDLEEAHTETQHVPMRGPDGTVEGAIEVTRTTQPARTITVQPRRVAVERIPSGTPAPPQRAEATLRRFLKKEQPKTS
jgi:hypothetical protein